MSPTEFEGLVAVVTGGSSGIGAAVARRLSQLMRGLVVTAPRQAEVVEVTGPVPAHGQLVVNVERVGICGTDVELYTGEMTYFGKGLTHFSLRLDRE